MVFENKDDLIDFLWDGESSLIADYLDQNTPQMASFFKQASGKDFSIKDLKSISNTLRGENENDIRECRTFISKCLNKHADKLPFEKPSPEAQTPKHTQPSLLQIATQVGQFLRRQLTPVKLALTGTIGAIATVAMLSTNSLPDESAPNISGVKDFISASTAIANSTANLVERATPVIIEASQNISSDISKGFRNVAQTYQANRMIIREQYPDSYYNPFLVKQLETDMQARQYVTQITQAALDQGLDPVLFTNQLFRESAQFNSDTVSGKIPSSAGAIGIAQIIPSTAAEYGFTVDEISDPEMAVQIGAHIMADLAQEYNGDQVLAMIAFNGGRGSIAFVQEKLNKDTITSSEWIEYMSARRDRDPVKSSSAWHHETLKYVEIITNGAEKENHIEWAREQQNSGLPYHMAGIGFLIANHGEQLNIASITASSQMSPQINS